MVQERHNSDSGSNFDLFTFQNRAKSPPSNFQILLLIPIFRKFQHTFYFHIVCNKIIFPNIPFI